MKTLSARTLRMQHFVYESLSAMWFIIAGLQYRDCGQISYILPAVFCGVTWMTLGSSIGRRRDRAGE